MLTVVSGRIVLESSGGFEILQGIVANDNKVTTYHPQGEGPQEIVTVARNIHVCKYPDILFHESPPDYVENSPTILGDHREKFPSEGLFVVFTMPFSLSTA